MARANYSLRAFDFVDGGDFYKLFDDRREQ
jgi:hypothetical protein